VGGATIHQQRRPMWVVGAGILGESGTNQAAALDSNLASAR
jgi:hypothetical protein